MIWRAFVYSTMLGALAGGVLGAWLTWQHDALVEFAIRQRSSVGFKPIGYVAFFGGLFGWAEAWCVVRGTEHRGAWAWGPVALGLLLSLAVAALWTHLALTTTSLPLLAIVMTVFVLAGTLAAALRLWIES